MKERDIEETTRRGGARQHFAVVWSKHGGERQPVDRVEGQEEICFI